MTAKKDAALVVSEAPMTFRDYPGEVPASEPPAVFVATQPVIEEPAKPAVKKEN